MPLPNEVSCPQCNAAPGCLSIHDGFAAKPLGSHALSGGQLKTSVVTVPILCCAACGLRLVGEYHYDEDHGHNHAEFEPPRPRRERS